MRIVTVAHAIPSTRITNDELLERIDAHNREALEIRQLEHLKWRARRFMQHAGNEVRYTLAEGEKAIDFGIQASTRALESAGLAPGEIDFVIYSSVNRGWLEPATAAMVQSELGIAEAASFDIVEACAGWLRAMQVAHSLIRGGTYRRGLIVNCECGLLRHQMDYRGGQEIAHRLASFTIGEAATATVVDDEVPADDFYFRIVTYGKHFDLCMVPIDTVADFAVNGSVDGRHRSLELFSRSNELISTTVKKIIEQFRADPNLEPTSYDVGFGHAASTRASQILLRKLGIRPEIFFDTHPRYGNTVSASVPLGISLALQEGRLRRGDRVLVVIGSAGISVGFASFVF